MFARTPDDDVADWASGARFLDPAEPAGGLRQHSVHLGAWNSPQGFPWEVYLVRADWFEWSGDTDPPDEAPVFVANGPDGVQQWYRRAADAAALFLVPLPYPSPVGLGADFRSWTEGGAGQAACQREALRWESDTMLLSLCVVWDETVGEIAAAEECVRALIEPAPARRGKAAKRRRQAAVRAIRDIAHRTPWMLVLSRTLLAAAIEALQAAPGASAQAVAGALTLQVQSRASASENAAKLDNLIRRGTMRRLVSAGQPASRASAYASRLSGPGRDKGWDDAMKHVKRIDERLTRNHVRPMLVPLGGTDLPDSDPVLSQWADRWLAGAGRQALSLVFGANVDEFTWTGIAEGQRAPPGLRVFEDWSARVETGPHGLANRFIHWKPVFSGASP